MCVHETGHTAVDASISPLTQKKIVYHLNVNKSNLTLPSRIRIRNISTQASSFGL